MRPGRGKGLYVARRMMHSIGGSMRVQNVKEGGVEVVLAIRDLRQRETSPKGSVHENQAIPTAPLESGQP